MQSQVLRYGRRLVGAGARQGTSKKFLDWNADWYGNRDDKWYSLDVS